MPDFDVGSGFYLGIVRPKHGLNSSAAFPVQKLRQDTGGDEVGPAMAAVERVVGDLFIKRLHTTYSSRRADGRACGNEASTCRGCAP